MTADELRGELGGLISVEVDIDELNERIANIVVRQNVLPVLFISM